jgi:hypothetical protein
VTALELDTVPGVAATPAIGIDNKAWVGQDGVDFSVYPYQFDVSTY